MQETWYVGVGPETVYIHTKARSKRRAMDIMLNCARGKSRQNRYSWGAISANPELLARDLLEHAGVDVSHDQGTIAVFAEEVIRELPPLTWCLTQEQIQNWWLACMKVSAGEPRHQGKKGGAW